MPMFFIRELMQIARPWIFIDHVLELELILIESQYKPQCNFCVNLHEFQEQVNHCFMLFDSFHHVSWPVIFVMYVK